MSSLDPAPPDIEAVIERLQAELGTGRRPGDFSEQSVDAVFDRQVDFVEELAREAIRQARRTGADVVSAADVERADQLVRGGGTGRTRLWEPVGGILAGAGVGEFIDVLSDDDPSTLAIALPTVFMLIGAVVMTVALLRR